MYTLAIPKRQQRRAKSYLKQKWIDFDETQNEDTNDGFVHLSFPDIDEDRFRDIVVALKRQGVTTIGADKELTEKNIMKLANLIKEDFSSNLDEQDSDTLIEALKNILKQWEIKQYPSDQHRWREYYKDILRVVKTLDGDK